MGVIERDTIQTLAIVDVSDGYGVELRQRRKRQEYSSGEALALAEELRTAALEARRAQRDDEAAWAQKVLEAVTDAPSSSHGFDVAPICRECKEGKHSACDGTAFVEDGDRVEHVVCGCHRVDHQVIGGAA